MLDISRLNFGIITLLPKCPRAENIKQFRTIALINVIFKLVSKAFAARLSPVAHRVISRSQSAFLKGRLIHDGDLALHEVVHELKSKNLPAVVLKLDFEKAYDRVSWAFLREVLTRKGFESGVIHRLMQLVTGGQTDFPINGEVGPFFRNKQGVRQGDPSSPILFNFMADALAGMLEAASRVGHIRGVVPNLMDGGVTHLQYADDTIILVQNSERELANLKFLLLCLK